MDSHGSPLDPYRILFPLGIVLGAMGVSVWPLYYFGVLEGYSGRAHAFVQTDGFLFAFIAGFLLTAIPRFTGTPPPSRRTQYVIAGIVTACAVTFEFHFFAIGNTFFLVSLVMLMALAARRFIRRQQNPPETFPLVGVGLFAGLIGGIIDAGIAWDIVSPQWDLLGKRLLTEGMALLLVLGIGGFLGPRLLGFAALPKFAASEKIPVHSRNRLFFAMAGVGIVLSLVAEYGFGFAAMSFLRAVAATVVILWTVQLWRLPAVHTTLAWCVWSAHWLIVVSLWLAAIAPRYRIDILHILFIGGFSLLILAVGTRVALSHGGHSLALEQRSWPLRIGLITGLIAMLARVGAPFSSATYFEHLAYAGVLWIAGMLIWGAYLLRWSSR